MKYNSIILLLLFSLLYPAAVYCYDHDFSGEKWKSPYWVDIASLGFYSYPEDGRNISDVNKGWRLDLLNGRIQYLNFGGISVFSRNFYFLYDDEYVPETIFSLLPIGLYIPFNSGKDYSIGLNSNLFWLNYTSNNELMEFDLYKNDRGKFGELAVRMDLPMFSLSAGFRKQFTNWSLYKKNPTDYVLYDRLFKQDGFFIECSFGLMKPISILTGKKIPPDTKPYRPADGKPTLIIRPETYTINLKPGEMDDLTLTIRNVGTGDASNVEIKTSYPFSSGISMRDDFYIGYLMADDTKTTTVIIHTEKNSVPGQHEIRFICRDKSYETTEATVIVNIADENDNEPPVITILEPEVKRGMKSVVKSKIIEIRGLVTDDHKIVSVEINRTQAYLNPQGKFWNEIVLDVGDNSVEVMAEDEFGNRQTETFSIEFTPGKDPEITASPVEDARYYALIIGIDNYSGYWSVLKNAVNDAEEVAAVLKEKYQFDQIELILNENATRRNILQKMEWYKNNLTTNDNLLIYFSGHGTFDDNMNRGYWVPVNVTDDSKFDCISNARVQEYLNGMQTRHTLLIADACFAGDIFRGTEKPEIPAEINNSYLKKIYQRKSRKALTSGGLEPVLDGGRENHSVFTYYLLKELKDNQEEFITALTIYYNLDEAVTNNSQQKPEYQPITNTGDEGGQFIFLRKRDVSYPVDHFQK